MSLWKIGADDVSEETQQFKDKLASKDGQIAGQQAKMMKQTHELDELKANLTEALQKLAAESERTLNLQNDLTQCKEDLRNERNASHNVEVSLEAANRKLKDKDGEMRELEATFERLSRTSNNHNAQSRKLEQEKSALEARVRDLASNVRHLESANAASSRRRASRSSSSRLDDLKLKELERDLQGMRGKLDEKDLEVKGLREKLNQAQKELLRVDNERLAQEMKTKSQLDDLRSLLREKDEELVFYKEQQDNGGREEELLQRIEEDEAKITALEAMLRQSDDDKESKEKLRRAEQRLKVEADRVIELEERQITLARERDDVLGELQAAQLRINGLEHGSQERQEQIDRLLLERSQLAAAIEEQRDQVSHSSDINQPKAPVDAVDVLHIARLLNAIARLRGERDDLRRNLQFLESEHRFTVEALEKRLTLYPPVHSMDVSVPRLNPFNMAIQSPGEGIQRHGQVVLALAILLSHSQHQLENGYQLLSEATDRQQRYRERVEADSIRHSALEEEADHLASQVRVSEEKISDLELRLEETMLRLEAITAQRNDLVSQSEEQEEEMKSARKDMQDRLEELDAHLASVSRTLEVVESERDSLALQVTNLTTDLEAAHDELANAESRYSALQSHQLSSMTPGEVMHALRDQIAELEGRVMRRTEQIGIHQHDIRRLETNLRLQEERLGEMTMELETLATQKEAMLEDCADAREARDRALAQIETLEEDLESLESKLAANDKALDALILLLIQTSMQARSVNEQSRSHLSRLEDQLEQSLVIRTALESSLTEIHSSAAHDARQVTVALASSQLQLREVNVLAKGLTADKVMLTRSVTVLNEQIYQQQSTIRHLKEECTTLQRGSSSSVAELAARSSEYQAEIDELRKVTSDLEAEKRRYQKQVECSSVDLQKLQGDKESLIDKHEVAVSHMRELHRGEVVCLQEELLTITATLDAERANWTTSEKDYQDALSQAQSQIDELRKRWEAANEELSLFSIAREGLEAERDKVRKESDTLRREVEMLLREREEHRQTKDDMTKTNQRLSEEIAGLLEERASVMEGSLAQADRRQEELSSLNQQLDSRISELMLLVENKSREAECFALELETTERRLKEGEGRHAAEMRSLLGELETAKLRLAALDEEDSELQKLVRRNSDKLNKSEEEKERLQEHITSLEAQIQKSLSYTNALERQVQDGKLALDTLKFDLSNTQAELSQAETKAKTAEVNLSLQSAQFKRELAKVQDELTALESRRNLEEALADLEERNNEMEELLRAKCAEIEENDDRALEMLKENKKLSSKVETLARKVQNLQTKLTAAKAAVANSKAPVDAMSTAVKPARKSFSQPPAQDTETQTQSSRRRSSRLSTGTTASLSTEKSLPASGTKSSTLRTTSNTSSANLRPKTPEAQLAPTPVFKLRTPEQPRAHDRTSEPSASVVGVKRRAPDDFEVGTVPPQGFTTESLPSRENESTTPRVRRMFGNLQSGFTPIRNKAQSSPKRQSAALSTPLIQDVTNSPRSSVPLDSAAKQKRSWLGKIRGTTSQTAVKPTSRQVFTHIGETQRP